MYVTATPGALVPVDEVWIQHAIRIFEGKMTCCRLGHPHGKQCDKELLVPPVLAMYTSLLSKVSKDGSVQGPPSLQIVWDAIDRSRSSVFPEQFTYTDRSAKRTTRQLFGSTIRWVDKLAENDDLNLITHCGDPSDSISTVNMHRRTSSGRVAVATVVQRLRGRPSHAARRISDGSDDGSQGFATQTQLRRHSTKESLSSYPQLRESLVSSSQQRVRSDSSISDNDVAVQSAESHMIRKYSL